MLLIAVLRWHINLQHEGEGRETCSGVVAWGAAANASHCARCKKEAALAAVRSMAGEALLQHASCHLCDFRKACVMTANNPPGLPTPMLLQHAAH